MLMRKIEPAVEEGVQMESRCRCALRSGAGGPASDLCKLGCMIGNGMTNVNTPSPNRQQLAGLDIRSCLHPVQVHSACEFAPVKLDLVNSRIPPLIYEHGNRTTQYIMHRQAHVRYPWQFVFDGRARVEGVG
jgi:hypothetical protein